MNHAPTSTADAPLAWGPAPAAARAGTIALLALLTALALRRAELVILAAAPLALLAAASRRTPPPTVTVAAGAGTGRAVEGQELTVTVAVTVPAPVDLLAVRLRPLLPLAAPLTPDVWRARATDRIEARYPLRPARWGRWPVGHLEITAYAAGGTRRAVAQVSLPELIVSPNLPAWAYLPRPWRLPRLAGDHVAGTLGSGTEFAELRPYQAGDPARLVHAAASARRGRLQVTSRHAEHLADVVICLDAYSDVGQPPRSSLDTAVRGAAGLAAGYLRAGDRVGAMLLGAGAPLTVPAGLGRAQLPRIVDLLMRARDAYGVVDPDLRRVPGTALPPGALVVLCSPLLDERVLDVLTQLQERALTPVVLDVLGDEPPARGRTGELALRLWRLDRAALHRRLARLGIVVAPAADLGLAGERLAVLRAHHPTGVRP
ncbi:MULTISPECIES: DUF58 domain-containing protein [Micromonospora]|uniref:DUF58 domain-containing protein n=1 Tax=Micromonospora solifontis TaxID=2487138 RepID=A0ABX9WC80_9ACTN|nr:MULTISPECIES: DUF58 domain-containing protein [Micromonospora]NES17001.1 DUF58 domain-containing protein [Micromonospora sp. PPF5-17B]NES38414.1 DUF58 domain-containing protein [Micromonospora solifontis]NES58718.1 DUF58 domain-containing protein [Micromonospora sp. PPF5-6]RNL95829.1 DUF58 domain-containing protein [Micromonospora solifontis]